MKPNGQAVSGDLKNLGNLLLMAQKITPEILESALVKQKASGRHLGTVLVGMGVLDPRDLMKMLVRQAELRSEKLDWVALGRQVADMVSLKHFRIGQKHEAVRDAAAKLGV